MFKTTKMLADYSSQISCRILFLKYDKYIRDKSFNVQRFGSIRFRRYICGRLI